jgi:hypothetical protein
VVVVGCRVFRRGGGRCPGPVSDWFLLLACIGAITSDNDSATPPAGDKAAAAATTAAGATTKPAQATTKPAAAATTKPAPVKTEPAGPGIGDAVKDGKFQFTVTKVECGKKSVGSSYLNQKAQGQFCLITIKVKNIGDEAQTFSGSNQKAFDAKGTEYENDTGAEIYANSEAQTFLTDINPGNAVIGKLVFHAGLPETAATYPLPADWRRRWGPRRYGFHGLSYAYAYATRRAAELLDRPADQLHIVLAHLGGGDSVCAVRDGRSVDTSMGFTPLDGVPMSTRSGTVDPGMLLWLLDDTRLSRDEMLDGLYHHAGLLGLSGDRSGDTRDLVAAAADGDQAAALALNVYTHRVRREIAAAATSLDRLDALVFTGEIGWDQPEVRRDICAGLGVLGVSIPAFANRDEDGPVHVPGVAVPVLVVQPREELQLALDTAAALRSAP